MNIMYYGNLARNKVNAQILKRYCEPLGIDYKKVESLEINESYKQHVIEFYDQGAWWTVKVPSAEPTPMKKNKKNGR